jgi:FkbM family methyltransferase
MKLQMTLTRLDKLSQVLRSARLMEALFRHRVLAGAEHRQVLARDWANVIDIGANRGQFALAVRHWAPGARVISFEPLPCPASVFRRVLAGDTSVTLHEAAVGPESGQATIHVSARDDSSSLLPISSLQSAMFPGTREVATATVHVAPLDAFIRPEDLKCPALLKLDVQGYEYEALLGCESLLAHFDWVYCECSFVELYSGQKLATDVIRWLSGRGFNLRGIHNPAYDASGQAVQGDFLFTRGDSYGTAEQLRL